MLPESKPATDAQNDLFLSQLPAIRKICQSKFRAWRSDPTRLEDLIQETIVFTYRRWLSDIQSGRDCPATIIARQCCRSVLAGRRAATPQNVHDIGSVRWEVRTGLRCLSFADEHDTGPGITDELVEECTKALASEKDNPAAIVIVALDYADYKARQSRRGQRILTCAEQGMTRDEIAIMTGMSKWSISGIKSRMLADWKATFDTLE